MRHLLLPVIAATALFCAAPPVRAENVLMMAGTGLARGGNSFVYASVSAQRVRILPGDRLEYDLLIAPHSAESSGGIDIAFDAGDAIRDTGVKDQNGADVHPRTVLAAAKGRWYHRQAPLDAHAGRTTTLWSLVLEGDVPGKYAIFVGNIGVRRADGTWVPVCPGGRPEREPMVDSILGYSREVIVRPVDRASVTEGADLAALVEREAAAARAAAGVRRFLLDVQLASDLASLEPDGERFRESIEAARGLARSLESRTPLSVSEVEKGIAAARAELSKAGPLMRRYKAYLVGHGHIDPQWQWEWPEILESCEKTFSQAIRFMDELPGFRYSQSSAALYRAVQEHYPELFRRIQRKVKEGAWEIVGGRVVEGDTNIVSAEGHARQFLLAQRYFRKWFGRTATVGWEPDTFGHSWSMPQILKLGGLDSYYFGRGGQGKPLFWWEGPDGTRILSFDETASGSWYDSGLDSKVLAELPAWRRGTGLKSTMWVYGVGNHGGGPTREQLQTAVAWKKTPHYPRVEFSGAAGFFSEAGKTVSGNLPVIRGELDPRIAGVFTTHGELKRLYRDAENKTLTAEVAATIASAYGRPYPSDRFHELWWSLCFNQHHDTVPGPAIHDSYANNYLQLPAVASESAAIADAATRFLANLATRPKNADYAVMAFNPLGWERGGEVRFPWPFLDDGRRWVAVSPSGERTPVGIIRGRRPDNPTGEPVAWFTARNVPGFGYSVYALQPLRDGESAGPGVSLTVESDRYVADNGLLRVTVQRDNGLVTSLCDVAQGRETLAPNGAANRVEVWYETPGPNDAWVVREYAGHDRLDGPAKVTVVDDGPAGVTIEVTRPYRKSSITQWIRLRAGAGQLDLPLWVDWREEGTPDTLTPFLKMACDAAGTGLKATYEIPFASIERPLNGLEAAALKSADLSGPEGGITLLNDGRSGYSAEGNTLRLSLVRTPNRLDPVSDVRFHSIRAAIVPHAGACGAAQMRAGFEWNQGLLGVRVPPSATGRLPLVKSFVSVAGDTVIPTALKRSEDDPAGLVVRLYEGGGRKARVTVAPDVDFRVARGPWVDFLEDPVLPEPAAVPAEADLRPFEIRSVLFRLR